MKKNLPFFKVVDYAIQHIRDIHDVVEIVNYFAEDVADISAEHQGHIPVQINATRFIGQQNYWFSFNDDKSFPGEFSVDLLPIDSVRHLQKESGGISRNVTKDAPASVPMKLSNFRAQLFSREESLSGLQARYIDMSFRLNELFGQPNSTSELKEISADLSLTSGAKDIMCWKKLQDGRAYLITGYLRKNPPEGLPYIAFAISEYLSLSE